MKPLTRAQIDAFGCGMPNCTHDHSVLYLIGRCHPEAGVDVRYAKATGILTVLCKKCSKLVADVEVAP
jgi:hypothetical protein